VSKAESKAKIYSGGRSFKEVSDSAHKAVETRKRIHPEWGAKKRAIQEARKKLEEKAKKLAEKK
jgi:hypothetical protein